MFVFDGKFEPHVATPFVRAMMRVEAELLLERRRCPPGRAVWRSNAPAMNEQPTPSSA
jgi:hypothetical protein